MKLKIKKGDSVQVISGSDKGKKGTVVQVDPKALKIKVEGVKVMTHFDKKEGLLKKEAFIPYSKVKLLSAGSTSSKPAKKPAKKAASKSKSA